MKRLFALALGLSPLAAQAQQVQCWLPYTGFEETVPHINLARCPGESMDPAEWVCRIVLRDDMATVYFFRHTAEAGMPCLIRVLRQDFNSFAAIHGTTYMEP
ncbi:hypothetical protein [Sediminicoccus sp. KRV36]|uniref:hypothetical protein n=1 Tax=Sediminicoccus sp. KRV36 TaxID=3133721 RepID=UPI00200D2254|nr:hypothetical protein [Sediminicoccus rosea]UPY35669.1 hypothetical protein LHU95_15735 [Sediminicoccus rosea]